MSNRQSDVKWFCSHKEKGSATAVATSAATMGGLAARSRSRGEMIVSCTAHRANGTVSVIIIPENPIATPLAPYLSPNAYAAITRGATKNANRRLRSMRPVAKRNQPKGLINANTTIVGAKARKIGAACVHFGPSKTSTMSVANKAHANVIGTVSEIKSE